MELLAPAGNREALERADAAGADAVYLGYAAFSARAGAGNFDRRELEEAVRYAHLRHMRVYVTVNTLVKDAELEAVTEVLRLLRDLRADAVLVQDPGVLRIARRQFPGLTVHASTQMAIHNRTGVLWCEKQGIRRVVLARECGLREIRRCADTGMEIEVFAHGAQCVAVSGLCLFSSMLGERSGNRGRCAQPCRMEYTYRGRRGAWLSPRDICLRDGLDRLREAGAVSVKLEGRLKRPEYVAVVTESYRKGLDSLARGAFEKADAKEKEGLLQIFNRGGFMDGYALGCEDAGVICPETVNHQGIRTGCVAGADGKLARVKLEKDLRDGDGLALRGTRGETGMVYAGPDRQAGETAILRLREGTEVRTGDAVFRLTDAAQNAAAKALKGRTVPANLFLRAMPGEALTLTVSDGESTVTAAGETVATARTRAATEEELARNLARTGDTVFACREIRVETEGAFVPVSQVNAIRREALSALAEARIRAFEKETETGRGRMEVPSFAASAPNRNDNEGIPLQLAYVRTAEQAEAAREAGLTVVRCPEDYRAEAMDALRAGWHPGDWLALPDVCEEDTLQALRRWTEKNRDMLGGVVLGSVGQLGADWPVPYGAGPGIPVMNRQAAILLSGEGCRFVTASQELTGQELKTLFSSERLKEESEETATVPIMTVVYGRARLMLLHHCPARTALGLSRGHRDCRMCDEGHPDALAGQALEDRKGYRFPLLRQRLPEGCLVQLMNALPTDVINPESIDRTSAKALMFSTEGREETEEILRAFSEGRKSPGETTSGHWKRPVE